MERRQCPERLGELLLSSGVSACGVGAGAPSSSNIFMTEAGVAPTRDSRDEAGSSPNRRSVSA